jgi:hypothetical protein
MPKHPPTFEQSRAVDLFTTGDSLKINAFAGTGKTTTLEYLAAHSNSSGIYLAFNKSIADDASNRFPTNVQCRTTHSLAYRSTPAVYRNNKSKMTDDLNANAVADILGLDDLDIGSQFSLSRQSRGALVRQSLKQFQHSDATEISASHVPRWGKLMALPKTEIDLLIRDTALMARTLWNRMLDSSDRAPLGHDGYFKRWSLNNPEIPANFILLDEAQDTNPAMLSALRNQSAQVIYVGDRFQQIYEWRGAMNAMDKVATRHECVLTQSFRFGEAIASAASRLLHELGEARSITGNPNIISGLGCAVPNAILCRTNAGVIDNVIQAFGAGITPYVVGGTADALRLLDGVIRLQKGQPTDVPEFFGFANWQEVVKFSESEEGQHIKTFVRLVERHGESKLRSYLSRVAQRAGGCSLIISTAHKAKGQEWDNVVVVDDFIVVQKTEEGKEIVDESELRLLYVALTRARRLVQIPQSLASRFGIQQDFQQLRLVQTPQSRSTSSVRRARPQYVNPTARDTTPTTPKTAPKKSAFKRFLAKLFGK